MKTLNYLLRDIDPALWQDLKHLAIDLDMTLREIIILAILDYKKKIGTCERGTSDTSPNKTVRKKYAKK